MDGLESAIQRCNLQLRLDNNTEGFGNCFPNAVVQQCRRPEIRTWLQKNKPWAIFTGQQSLRIKVKHFAMKSRHQAVADLRTRYEEVIGPVDNKSWSDYWNEMAQDGTWVDHIFIQVIAWYIELDILILTTSSKPESPFIFISGNINNIPSFNTRPTLLLGNYTNVHYQSLLPNNEPMTSGNEQQSRLQTISQEQKTEDFIFIQNDKTVTFKVLEAGKLQCSFCSQSFIRIVTHINNQNCKIYQLHIDITEFKSQLDSFREGYRLDMSRKRKQKNRTKLSEEKGPEVLKAEQNKHIKKSRAKILEERGPEVIKVEQNRAKAEPNF